MVWNICIHHIWMVSMDDLKLTNPIRDEDYDNWPEPKWS